ncbi:alpha/beta fold hydrolase [Mucilaginibacter sp. L196]|uniref:alpha/beta fold hydrolase n=1 Tax=Mucilaginibacter sp. L196 TaxID=1641870 RepID=UPI00131E0EFC|nr:alpha/beta hydrolase [Mucilaginibacter sp. L196]
MKKISRRLLPLILLTTIFSCNHSEHKDVDDQGVNIAYTDTGKGDTTLLFVHGWCINKSYWSNQVAYFSKRYRVVAFDMPGFGGSGKNRTDWSTYAYGRDVDSVISQLKLTNVILIGHSMAGDIVLEAAINNPKVIGLVGIDNFKNVGHIENAASKKDFADAIAVLKHNFKSVAVPYFKQDLFSKTTSTAIQARVLNDVAHADTTIAAAALEQGNSFDELAKLHQVKMKLYLINSDVHPAGTTGLIRNKIPYQLLYIHGTGHFPMIEAPADFNLLLEKVIRDIKKGNS